MGMCVQCPCPALRSSCLAEVVLLLTHGDLERPECPSRLCVEPLKSSALPEASGRGDCGVAGREKRSVKVSPW